MTNLGLPSRQQLLIETTPTNPMKFKTTIFQSENNTGIEVPPEIVEKLGAGKKPPVVVTINSYTYRNTIAVMGG